MNTLEAVLGGGVFVSYVHAHVKYMYMSAGVEPPIPPKVGGKSSKKKGLFRSLVCVSVYVHALGR